MDSEQQEAKKGKSMNSLVFFVLFIAVYFGLQFFVLPKLGVPT